MNVNFTGLSNIYGLKVAVAPETITGSPFRLNEKVYLSMRLKDDFDGNDLSEFKSAIATTDSINKKHPIRSDFLSVAISKLSNVTKKGTFSSDYKIYVNDGQVPMNVNRQNMKFFTYLATLFKKINKLPNDKFVVNEDFKNSEDLASFLLLDKVPFIDVQKYKNELFTPYNAKSRSENLLEDLQGCMEQYLNS